MEYKGHVSTTVCELKHRSLDREVAEMKRDVKEMRECISKKFGGVNKLLYAVLGALVVNLAVALIVAISK